MSTEPRVNLGKQHGASYQALLTLSEQAEQHAHAAGLDPLLVELVKLRTSQLNGCAYCLRLHTRAALSRGESPDRLAVLSAWRETSYFSEQERAALALAESVTHLTTTRVADDDYASARAVLTDAQLSAVAWVTTVMNAFNRVAVTSGYAVGPDT